VTLPFAPPGPRWGAALLGYIEQILCATLRRATL
jgi:hypothetical protein